MAESEEEPKSLLMTVKEESEKGGLKYNIKKTKIMASIQSHHFMANIWGNNENSKRTLFIYLTPKSLQMVTVVMKLENICSLEEKLWPT